MNWNRHYELEGKHAYLSPSKHYWINYDELKLTESYINFLAVEEGTELHDIARRLIERGIELYEYGKTYDMYVNDCIRYRMTPEQVLKYSDRCFGTADAISFDDDILRINDLKTGKTPAHMEQLMIYAALFCLEYNKNPKDIRIELRIYQDCNVIFETPSPEVIEEIMKKIITCDQIIYSIELERGFK